MIRVEKTGLIVPLVQGYTEVAGRKVALGYGEVKTAGVELRDDQVGEDLLERVKAGEVKGMAYYKDGEDPPALPADASPSSQETDKRQASEEYDPSEYTQDSVLNYLETASADEVERVKAVEAEGQNRKKIAEFKPKGEDE